MEAPNSLQPPPNGQLQRQKKSPHTNKQQQWRKSGHNNYNNNNKQKFRIPPQQQQKKRRSNGQRGGQTELGFFGSVPSLQDLQRENRKRTRRYYGNNQQRGAFPLDCSQMPILKTKPLPPYFPSYLSHEHDNNKSKLPWLSPTGRFLAPPAPTPARFPGASPATGNPLATPMIPANQDGAADKLEAQGLHAGLDFFATNDGLVLYNDTPAPSSWTDDEDDNNGEMDDSHSFSGSEDEDNDGDGEEGGGSHRRRAQLRRRPAGSTLAGNGFAGIGGGGGGAHGRIIHRLRDRVAQQDAYIAELEDDNLGLRAKLHLLVHQLRETQEAGAADLEKNDETSKEHEHEPPAAVAAAAEVTVKHGKDDDASEMNESPAVKV